MHCDENNPSSLETDLVRWIYVTMSFFRTLDLSNLTNDDVEMVNNYMTNVFAISSYEEFKNGYFF